MSKFLGLYLGAMLALLSAHALAAASPVDGSWTRWLRTLGDVTELKVRWSPDKRQVESVRGPMVPSDAALSVEERVRGLAHNVLRLQKMAAEELGEPARGGTQNRKSFRYPQRFEGLPVEGHAILFTIDRHGTVVGMENTLVPFTEPITPVVISGEQARIRAFAALKHLFPMEGKLAESELIVLPVLNTPVRIWRVPVAALPYGLYSVYIRADDGRILWIRDQMIR